MFVSRVLGCRPAFNLTNDPGPVRLAQIVYAADVSEDRHSSAEGLGLYAAHGFALLHGTEDHTKIELETPTPVLRPVHVVTPNDAIPKW